MDKINFELSFRSLNNDENLYDGVDVHMKSVVQAEYIRREGYEENPDVCAIPKCPSKLDVLMMASIEMPAYNYENVAGMELYEIKEQIADLQHVIHPLGVHFELAYMINKKLLESYKSRETRVSYTVPEDSVLDTTRRILSLKKPTAGRAGGFLMTGVTGCGKTMALSLICSMYPEAIRHKFPDYEYIQIPIIRVTALMGSLSDIYTGVATRLDQILDCGDFHERQVRNKHLTYAGGLLKDWIERYHIGLLIIDEIQFLDFGNGRTSFENIVGITERTGMAFGLVGNNESLDKIHKLPRIASRLLTNHIVADQYENSDKQFFVEAIKELWRYQWGKEYIPITRELVEALILETSYNIALLKSLLVTIQLHIVSSKVPVVVDYNWIHKIAGKDFQQMRNLITNRSVEGDREFQRMLDERFGNVKTEAQQEFNKYKSAALEDMRQNERSRIISRKIQQAVDTIVNSTDYSGIQAKRAVKKVFEDDINLQEASIKEIVRAVKALLDEAENKRKKKQERTGKKQSVSTSLPDEIYQEIKEKVMESLECEVSA